MRCQSSPRRWNILAAAGLLTVPLFLPAVPGVAPAGEPVPTDYFPLPAGWALGATPDSANLPREPHPEPQRIRWLPRLGADRWHPGVNPARATKIACPDSGFPAYPTHLVPTCPP